MVFISWFNNVGFDVKVCNGLVWLCFILDWVVIGFIMVFCKIFCVGMLLGFVLEIFILWVVMFFFWICRLVDWIIGVDVVILEFWECIFVFFILFLMGILFCVNFVEFILNWERDDLVLLFEDVIIDGIVICSILEFVRIWGLCEENVFVVFIDDWEGDNFFIFCSGELGCILGDGCFIDWFVDFIEVDNFLVWFVCFILGFGFLDDVSGFFGLLVLFKGFFFVIILRGSVFLIVEIDGVIDNCLGFDERIGLEEMFFCKVFDVICKWVVEGFGFCGIWGVNIIGLLIFWGIFRFIISLMSCLMLELFFIDWSWGFMLILFIEGGRFVCIKEGIGGWIVVGLFRFVKRVIFRGCWLIVKVEWLCIDLGGVIGGKLKFFDGKVGVGGVLERSIIFCVWRYFWRILFNKELGFLGNIGFIVEDCGI